MGVIRLAPPFTRFFGHPNTDLHNPQNVKTNETWSWRASQLPPPDGYDWLTAFSIKCSVLAQAALAFLLISAVTAIIVRMLMTSGVVVLFPLFFILRRAGVLRVLDFRLLSLSYPWLGVPLQRLRARRKPLTPFIMAHVVRVFVLYIMYEASQLFFAQVLYGKVRIQLGWLTDRPGNLDINCLARLLHATLTHPNTNTNIDRASPPASSSRASA